MAHDPDNPQDPSQGNPVQGAPEMDRSTIREVIQAQHETVLQEQAEARAVARRKGRQERAAKRKTQLEDRARQVHAKRVKALNDSSARVSAHVGTASRSLSAALRVATEFPMPRHTAEGREQHRIVRALEAALASIRRVGRGTFHETDIDLSAEVDAV